MTTSLPSIGSYVLLKEHDGLVLSCWGLVGYIEDKRNPKLNKYTPSGWIVIDGDTEYFVRFEPKPAELRTQGLWLLPEMFEVRNV